MLRKFLFPHRYPSSLSQAKYSSTRLESTTSSATTLNAYHEASDNKLEELSDKLESALEDRYDQGADVSLSNGVLTAVVDDQHTFVINKQTPNRQIWLSSPISGPRRFDFIEGKWVDKLEKVELDTLLSKELSTLLKTQYDF